MPADRRRATAARGRSTSPCPSRRASISRAIRTPRPASSPVRSAPPACASAAPTTAWPAPRDDGAQRRVSDEPRLPARPDAAHRHRPARPDAHDGHRARGRARWPRTTSGTADPLQTRVFCGYCRDLDTGQFQSPAQHCWQNGMAVGPAVRRRLRGVRAAQPRRLRPGRRRVKTITAFGTPAGGICNPRRTTWRPSSAPAVVHATDRRGLRPAGSRGGRRRRRRRSSARWRIPAREGRSERQARRRGAPAQLGDARDAVADLIQARGRGHLVVELGGRLGDAREAVRARDVLEALRDRRHLGRRCRRRARPRARSRARAAPRRSARRASRCPRARRGPRARRARSGTRRPSSAGGERARDRTRRRPDACGVAEHHDRRRAAARAEARRDGRGVEPRHARRRAGPRRTDASAASARCARSSASAPDAASRTSAPARPSTRDSSARTSGASSASRIRGHLMVDFSATRWQIFNGVRITVNDEPRELPAGATVADLVAGARPRARGGSRSR